MTPRTLRWSVAGAVLILAVLAPAPALAVPVVFMDSGANAAAIQDTVDAFRAALGDPNNGNAPGPLGSGRREINWDGGAATDGTSAVTPFIVFQNSRGATFTTPGSGLTQTPITGGTVDIAPGLGGLQANLADINPTYATAFATFSPLRLFAPLDSNIIDGTFSVPGTGGAKPATVAGFGAVFTDVDLADSTSLQFFDLQGNSLGTFAVPAGGTADGSLSFLGVTFTPEQIASVRIVTGNSALGPNDGGAIDVALPDDFIYAEPQKIPEPATLLLFGAAFAGLALVRKRKR
jgi:hypothetical protein